MPIDPNKSPFRNVDLTQEERDIFSKPIFSERQVAVAALISDPKLLRNLMKQAGVSPAPGDYPYSSEDTIAVMRIAKDG